MIGMVKLSYFDIDKCSVIVTIRLEANSLNKDR